MRRIKGFADPMWLIWEGDDFPRTFHSDSVIFYLSEHVYLDQDEAYKTSLAKAILREGISLSTGHSFRLINSANVVRSGYRFDDGDERFPVYCDNDDPDLDYDATFVEIAYVD